MRRTPRPNPEIDGLTVQRVSFNHGDEAKDWAATLPPSLPPNCEYFVNWNPENRNSQEFDIGVRKINSDKLAKPAPAGGKVLMVSELESLDTKSDSELKTLAGKIGVNYADRPAKGILVERVRSKLQEAK